MKAVNRDKPDQWKADIIRSVDMYNKWFIRFAPKAYREMRAQTTQDVKEMLTATDNLKEIDAELLKGTPTVLPTLRMATSPPLAVDRLIGLSGVSANLVKVMEKKGKLPSRMLQNDLNRDLRKISKTIHRMINPDKNSGGERHEI